MRKHGLDFANAGWVLDSRWRMDVPEARNAVVRIRSISYALGVLAVLTVVHTPRRAAAGQTTARVISFRRAKKKVREAYDEWLQIDHEDQDSQ